MLFKVFSFKILSYKTYYLFLLAILFIIHFDGKCLTICLIHQKKYVILYFALGIWVSKPDMTLNFCLLLYRFLTISVTRNILSFFGKMAEGTSSNPTDLEAQKNEITQISKRNLVRQDTW